MISISIVSHGQGQLLPGLMSDLARFADQSRFEVILTRNIPEVFPFTVELFPYPVKVIDNESPKGFGANHNGAFLRAEGEYFCVMNPDIRMPENPFIHLLSWLGREAAGVVGPLIVAPNGTVEDSARRFPTPLNLTAKLLGLSDGRYAVPADNKAFTVDWIGGMFMLFQSKEFRCVNGFDEGYFLYYEDVDLCARLWKNGQRVMVCPAVQVIHDARRSSRRNLRYLRWHLASMARYLGKNMCCLQGRVNSDGL